MNISSIREGMRLLFAIIAAGLLLLLPNGASAAPPRSWGHTVPLSRGSERVVFHLRELGTVSVALSKASSSQVHSVERRGSHRSTQMKPISFRHSSIFSRRSGASLVFDSLELPNNQTRRLFLPFLVVNSRRNTPAISYEVFLEVIHDGNLRVARVRRRPLIGKGSSRVSCPVSGNLSLTSSIAPTSVATTDVGAVELRVDVDSYFYSLYKTDTAAIVALVLRKVNQIYQSQLGVTVRLGELTIFSDPATDPYASRALSYGRLLIEVGTYREGASGDLTHLFTSGRGFIAAIGLAYLGSVCQQPYFTYAWDDYASGFDVFAQTVAHEMGHGFGASHDQTDPGSLMSVSAQVNVVSPYFSTASIAQIQAYLSNGSACLSDLGGSEIPDPGSVSYPLPDELARNITVSIKGTKKGKRGTVSGLVKSKLNGRLKGRIIELRLLKNGKLLSTTLSDAKGRYSFKVKLKRSYYTDDRLSLRTSPIGVKL